MFRYMPPWQVLCNSLGHEFKRQTSIVKDSPSDACIHPPEKEQVVIHSHHSLRRPYPKPAQTHPPPTVPMTSTPKRWVIKPLSPKLEQSDLRFMLSPTALSPTGALLTKSPDPWSSDQDSMFSFESVSVTGVQPTVMVSYRSDESDVVVQAQQVAVSEDGSDSEDLRPSSPGSLSSTGSHVGFYSFVEDPASAEAEMNEVYMLSPARQAKLNTLKEKNTFRLQTYMEDKKPGRLFEETNGDEHYRVKDVSEENEVEDSPGRTEIIRNQAPKKKSPALKEQWSALENLDLSNTPQRLLDGFSLRYTPVSPKAADAKVEPDTIDKEQIDFNAARKQFLMMEQKKQKPFPLSPQQFPYSLKLRGRTLSPMANIFPSKKVSPESSLGEDQIPLRTQLEANMKSVSLAEDPEDGVLSSAIDDVDSGLGDRVGGYGSDGSITNDPSGSEIGSNLSTYIEGETPIEREIRINQEREESLRRSRGILRSDSSEMVEIRAKPILTQIRPAKTKDTNRVSFLIQREVELEKRQQNQNKVLNQEHQPEVKEKMKAFEPEPDGSSITSFRTNPRESPTYPRESPTYDLQERTSSLKDIAEEPVQKEKDDFSDSKEVLSPCCPHRHPEESTLQKNHTEGRTFGNQDITYPTENIHSKVRVYKKNIFDTQTSPIRTKTEPFRIAENGMSRKNRLSLTFQSQLEPTKTSQYVPTWRSHFERTSQSPQMMNAPESIRQEIEQDLKREQELQELRESGSQSFLTNRDMNNPAPKNLKLTSTKHRQQTVFSPQTPQKNLTEVNSVLPGKQKTDDGYLVSPLSMPDSGPQLSSPRLTSRMPSVSITTPQPWGGTNPMSPTVSRVTSIKPSDQPADVSSPLSQKGLTETLLKDFEDRRVKLKLEENAYAGIQPVDAINNEVVEATRVTRHKNQRALQWEAGMYANQEA